MPLQEMALERQSTIRHLVSAPAGVHLPVAVIRASATCPDTANELGKLEKSLNHLTRLADSVREAVSQHEHVLGFLNPLLTAGQGLPDDDQPMTATIEALDKAHDLLDWACAALEEAVEHSAKLRGCHP